jgi:hypothetical protein
MTRVAKRTNQVVHVQLGAAVHERRLRTAHANIHSASEPTGRMV